MAKLELHIHNLSWVKNLQASQLEKDHSKATIFKSQNFKTASQQATNWAMLTPLGKKVSCVNFLTFSNSLLQSNPNKTRLVETSFKIVASCLCL
jgi:hypothetical protein